MFFVPALCPLWLIYFQMKEMNKIYKSSINDEQKEMEFELDYLLSLTVEERFQMMFEKSRIIKNILARNGHRKAFEIIKRK